MQAHITDFSLHISRLLTPSSSGIVHSVYHRTINLMFHGRLAALQSRGSVLSPVSLLTDQEDLLAATGELITPGIPVQITEDQGILFAGIPLEISFRNADGHDLALSPCLDPLRLSDLAGQLLYTISTANDHGFHQLFLPDADIGSSFVLSAAQQRIQSCTRLYQEERYKEAAASLSGLIGLGIGLTPSGDDFLCGVLAGLTISMCQDHPFALALQDKIRSRLSDTNDISRSFLSCALEGQFSQPVVQLSSMVSPEEISREFARIGHSSGMDTLSGIYYILSL